MSESELLNDVGGALTFACILVWIRKIAIISVMFSHLYGDMVVLFDLLCTNTWLLYCLLWTVRCGMPASHNTALQHQLH